MTAYTVVVHVADLGFTSAPLQVEAPRPGMAKTHAMLALFDRYPDLRLRGELVTYDMTEGDALVYFCHDLVEGFGPYPALRPFDAARDAAPVVTRDTLMRIAADWGYALVEAGDVYEYMAVDPDDAGRVAEGSILLDSDDDSEWAHAVEGGWYAPLWTWQVCDSTCTDHHPTTEGAPA